MNLTRIWKKEEWSYVECIWLRMVSLMVIYSITRIFFYNTNSSSFGNNFNKANSIENIFNIVTYGVLFDLRAILFINAPFILIQLIPFPFRDSSLFKTFIKGFFYFVNIIAILINVADIYYFQHAQERSSGSILGILSGARSMLWQYTQEYWYGWIIFFSLTLVFIICNEFIKTNKVRTELASQLLILLIVMVPVYLITKQIFYYNGRQKAIVTNTPYVLINSILNDPLFFNNKKLIDRNYFNDKDIDSLINLSKYYYQSSYPSEKENIVIIVLESFSLEFLNKQNTPFLDSLSKKGVWFTNFFANGRHSNEGIPAIFASIPAMMKESFISSKYKNNRILGLAEILEKENYSSAFFHGGTNGVYGFDFFTKKAGFKKYFGRTEFSNDRYYDGSWGIWDKIFFQFVATNLEKLKPPFIAGIFSVSSHHPFKLPTDYQPHGNIHHPIVASIGYTDYSLKSFFQKAKKMPWYKNTLFIITADHTANVNSHSEKYSTSVGRYRIPLLIFKPNSTFFGRNEIISQQIDIAPTIIDILNLDVVYKGFGKSVVRKSKANYAFQLFDNFYQIIDSTTCLQFDGKNVVGLYKYGTDSLMKSNMLHDGSSYPEDALKYLKVNIQYFNKGMNSNQLYR